MMNDDRTTIFEGLAECVDYPRPTLAVRAATTAECLRDEQVEESATLAAALEEVACWAAGAAEGEAEERYTVLFDLKPVATLNVSHHLLGDTYQRGAVLAGLAGELNRAGLEHTHDLPDHISTLLRLLPRLDDPDDRRLLVHTVMLPGLEKVLEKLERSPGCYPVLLRAICDFLRAEFPAGDAEILVLRKPVETPSCSM